VILNADFKLPSQLPFVPSESIRAQYERAVTEPVSQNNLWIISRHNEISRDNLVLNDVSTAIDELSYFRDMGGTTIVELSGIGLGRDPLGLRKISISTGVNIVTSTGFYTEISHPKYVQEATVDELEEKFVNEITIGIENTEIKAGIIGEIGTSTVMTDQELKVLRGACRAQLRTNVALSIHLANIKGNEAERVVKIVEEEGVDLNRLILGHMDVSYAYLDDIERLSSLARKGAYLEFDTFSLESYDPDRNIVFPRDIDRVKCVKKLLDLGLRERILLSQDIDMKTRLKRWGGQGYDHILRNMSALFKLSGLTDDDFRALLVENPARVLAG
jgi:phosphotriesterase-related protein